MTYISKTISQVLSPDSTPPVIATISILIMMCQQYEAVTDEVIWYA